MLQHKVFDSHSKQFLFESSQIIEGEERRMYCCANLVTNRACKKPPQAVERTLTAALDASDPRVIGEGSFHIKTNPVERWQELLE